MSKNGSSAKVLALDLETSPALVWSFSLWPNAIGIDQIEEHPYILGVSLQWEGSKRVEWYDVRDEKAMFDALHAALDKADIVIGWNSDRFDLPWLEGELQLRGYKPPSPVHKVDLMKHFRRHSRFISKKLAYVSDRVLGDTKVPHQGFRDLWWPLISPKASEEERNKAWRRMIRYAKKDTALMFPMFNAVRGWIKLPIPLSADGDYSCTNCGSLDVQRRGIYRTQASVFQRWQCQEPDCGKWGRSALRERPSNLIRPI